MKEKILDKIKKLLRLAASSNPNEAALALSRAQKLMQEHGIQSDTPELAGVNEQVIDAMSKAKTPTKYFGMLAHSIAKAFGCEYYLQPTFTNMGVVFIGHDERPKIAGYVFAVLERQLMKARKEFIESLSSRMKKQNKTKRADQFCEGWCIGVYRKIEQFALSDKEQQEIQTFKQSIDDLSSCNAREAKGSGVAADESKRKGYAAARDVTLNHGVSGNETMKLGAAL
ncbi:DUF2786 domain-containing protein [Vibrio gazogenes]|uniref:Uncharacterized protein n=1 Tax=Vibrio gazogenes DSM 21264 = NBRC 103151 TaxID=1123492 RepID=A0A1M5F7T6_VIBGA|nr:DUF2786 domain-containing protein [Vibrio gazogenes]USP15444.1 DUF2786 domain-containing protein [Vibrio gazogenes]SHF87575.1 Protein of unknown function [Vibrio gazogenes DSM 21264] [Vibrio gazogenes DSM 21264 = NBRC 103151]SJN54508.1 hypothetical protein BQ6471_01046 [Vibrio gazogenes]